MKCIITVDRAAMRKVGEDLAAGVAWYLAKIFIAVLIVPVLSKAMGWLDVAARL